MPRPTTLERAAKYIAAMPAPRRAKSDPQDSHSVVFGAACALVKGFKLSPAQAEPLLRAFCAGSDQPWTDRELEHKLRQADTTPDPEPRGYLLGDGKHELGSAPSGPQPKRYVAPKPVFDPELLKRTASRITDKVNLLYFANRSAVDPATVTTDAFLRAVTAPGEKILCFNVVSPDGMPWTQGEAVWPDEVPPTTGRCGVWWLPQPVDGKYRPNPRTGKTSRRSEESVQAWRWLVIESDDAPLMEWMAVLVQLPLKIVAVYTSGGRSVHALVRVDAATKGHWDALIKGDETQTGVKGMAMGMRALIQNGADKGVLSAVRLTRLPGCMREGKIKEDADGKYSYVRFPKPLPQKLLYLNPGADGRPICELMVRRNVAENWFQRSKTYEDEGYEGRVAILDGLLYYYPVGDVFLKAAYHLCRGKGVTP